MPAETTPSSPGDSLKGKILIAMPNMADPRFEHGVILMLEHGAEGAMGVMVNKPLDAVAFDDLLDQLEIAKAAGKDIDLPVFFGGPMEIGRGFVMHSRDVMLAHTLAVPPIGVTTSLDMLTMIANGKGPQHVLFALGYAGWAAGQLDEEIRQNVWLEAALSDTLLFDTPVEKRWGMAMRMAGIDPDHLSATAGRA